MLTFKEVAHFTQKRYNLSMVEANQTVKSWLEDIRLFKEKMPQTIEEWEAYINNLENYGK